jgi:hypothetical protein
VAAENRLTAEQLAALVPGDTVTIETSGDFRRPKLSTGTVVRIEGSRIVVSTRSARGIPYVDQYGRRDGVRVGGGSRAELINGEPIPAVESDERRRQLLIDAAYRAWARNRSDVQKLRELQTAVGEALADRFVTPS